VPSTAHMQTFSPTTDEAMAETHEPHHNEVVGMTTQLSNCTLNNDGPFKNHIPLTLKIHN